MPDIFDTLEAPKSDIFDQIAPEKKGDIFDQVSSPAAASAPESASPSFGTVIDPQQPKIIPDSPQLLPSVAAAASPFQFGSNAVVASGGHPTIAEIHEAGSTPLVDLTPDISPRTAGNIASIADISGIYHGLSAIYGKDHADRLAAGAIQGAGAAASSLLTPENITLAATVGGAPLAIRNAVGAMFLAQMTKGLPEQVMEAANEKDPQTAAKLWTQVGAGAALVGTLGGELGGRHPAVPSTSQDKGQQIADTSWRGGQEPMPLPETEVAPMTAQALRETASVETAPPPEIAVEGKAPATEPVAATAVNIPDVLTEDVKTQPVKTPTLKPGQKQGDLLGGSEDLTLVGEKAKSEAAKPAEKPLTVQETVSEAVAAYGDAASAHEHLGKQIEALSADKKNKPTVDRLRAAQRKIENVLEEEHRRSEQAAQDEKMGQQHHELVQSVKDLGGLPVLGGKGKYATGELGRIIESSKGAFLGLFRKDAKSLDTLRENLADRGFSFETPYDMLTAIEDSIRTGKKRYGTEFPPDYRGGPGAMGPEEAAQMEAERKILSGRNVDVEASQIRRGQTPTVSEARKEDPVTFERAMDAIEKDPDLPEKLVESIHANPAKPITDEQQQMLTYRRAELENKMAAEAERAADPHLSLEERQAAQLNAEFLESKLLRAEQANRMAGTASGRSLRSRQMDMHDDYTFAGISYRERKRLGRELTKEESDVIRHQADEIAKAQEAANAGQLEHDISQEKADLEAKMQARENDKGAAEGATYHPRVMEHARKIVERAQEEAEASWKEIRRIFGSESGAVGGVGGPKGEGRKMGEAQRKTLIEHVAKIIKAKAYKFGMTMADAADAVLLQGGDISDKIRPILTKAVARATSMMEKELGDAPPKVKEAVKKGKAAKVEPTKEEVAAKRKAAFVAEGALPHDVVAEIVNGMIDAGRRDRAGIMADAHKIVQEFAPDATERDVRRAYVEYGKKTYPNPDEAAAAKRHVRAATKIEEDIARLQEVKARRPELTGRQRDKIDIEIRDLQSRRSELLKNPNLPPAEGAFASKDEAKQTRIKNRMEEINRELAEGIAPPGKTPTAADSAKTEQLRAEKDAMQSKLDEIRAEKNPPLSEAQKALDSAMVARERAAQTLDDISTGKLKPDSPKAKEALTQLEEDVRMETDAMKQLAAEMRRDAKPKGDPGYAREQAQIKALEKAIDRYTEKTAAGDFTTTGKKLGPDSRRLAQLKEIRDSRRSMYQTARDAGKPVRSPEERYNDTRMKALTKREGELKERLRTGNFAPKPKPVQPKLRADVLAQKAKVETLKRAVDMEAKKKILQARPWYKKAGDLFQEARGVVLGSDIGVLTRQGLFSWARPISATKATYHAFKAALSPESMMRWEVEIRDREINGESAAPKRKAAGLQMTDTLNHPEELVITRLLSRIPDFNVGGKTIKLSEMGRTLERFQTTFINAVRADIFDTALKQGMSPSELELRANFINSATGRSNIKYVPRTMSAIFTSPRYEASRWEMLAQPVRNIGALAKAGTKGTLNKAALANIQDMAVTAAGIYAIYKLAEHAGGYRVNWNPTSTDFLKMRKGDEVWDVSAGLAPRLRDVMRLYVAFTNPNYKQTIGKTLLNMGLRTINPAITIPLEQGSVALQRHKGVTKPVLPLTGFRSEEEREGLIALAPLIVQSTDQSLKDGPGRAAFTAAREFVGGSVNRYPEPKEQSAPHFTDPALKSALRIPR